jgi:hypothetical protein
MHGMGMARAMAAQRNLDHHAWHDDRGCVGPTRASGFKRTIECSWLEAPSACMLMKMPLGELGGCFRACVHGAFESFEEYIVVKLHGLMIWMFMSISQCSVSRN